MGVNISSSLMVHVINKDLDYELREQYEEAFGGDSDDYDIHDILDYLGMQTASPYYDSVPEDWQIGIDVGPCELTDESSVELWNERLKKAKHKMVELFGNDIRLCLSSVPHIT